MPSNGRSRNVSGRIRSATRIKRPSGAVASSRLSSLLGLREKVSLLLRRATRDLGHLRKVVCLWWGRLQCGVPNQWCGHCSSLSPAATGVSRPLTVNFFRMSVSLIVVPELLSSTLPCSTEMSTSSVSYSNPPPFLPYSNR